MTVLGVISFLCGFIACGLFLAKAICGDRDWGWALTAAVLLFIIARLSGI